MRIKCAIYVKQDKDIGAAEMREMHKKVEEANQ
jgi:hypothetical protein